jgi:glycerophosphoryl diester phosphodiesterase
MDSGDMEALVCKYPSALGRQPRLFLTRRVWQDSDRARTSTGCARHGSEGRRRAGLTMLKRNPAEKHGAQRFTNASRPLVFAHRGGSALAPENTVAAFDNGLALGADGLELDVHLSSDGVVVVHHDARLERTTDGTGLLKARTTAELERLDAGYRFGEAEGCPWKGKGLVIPKLSEVLRRYPSIPLIIELKEDTAELARAVVRQVLAADAAGRVCLGSFGRRAIRTVRAIAPELLTSASRPEVRRALLRTWFRLPLQRAEYDTYLVPKTASGLRVVSPRFVRFAHAAGRPVHVWTVDTPQEIRRLLDWGVAGVISDRPDEAVATVDAWVRERRSRQRD